MRRTASLTISCHSRILTTFPLLSKWVLTLLIAYLVQCLILTEANHVGTQKLGYVYWRNATRRSPGSVIPRPKQIQYTNGLDYLEVKRASFVVQLDSAVLIACPSLEDTVSRYERTLFFDDVAAEPKDDDDAPKRRRLGELKFLKIGSLDRDKFRCEPMPHLDMDESYQLVVSSKPPGARLAARTNWGLVRGLETFSQLMFSQGKGRPSFSIQPVRVSDEPRFKHRGFMIDTARHFISLKNIFLLIDAMAYNKLNVLHWHMTDDQSFPLQTKVYPQLSKLNSFRPNLIYTRAQVQSAIVYGASRGIRVVPELDTPGHSYSMRSIPNLLSECYDTKTKTKNGDFGPIDPTRETSYEIVDNLLEEFVSLFGDKFFHAGGDEVDFDCWKSNLEISDWMSRHNMSGNYEELSNYYIRRLNDIITNKHHKTMLVWQEVFDMGAKLPKNNTVIHVWKNINDKPGYMAEMSKVVESGYNALLSSCWYLNYIDYGQDWVKFYQCDPRSKEIQPSKAHQVLGGEICMWTEFVDDTNVLSRTWPRASAAAERLWSPVDANDTEEFLHRLEQHRCRLLARGINAEPVNGPGYC